MGNKATNLARNEPVGVLSAVWVLGDAIIGGVQYMADWSGQATVQLGTIWTAFVGVLGAVAVRSIVTPNTRVDEQANTRATNIINDLVEMQKGN